MTYRNKLLLKRLLVVLAILAVIILIALLIGFTYLGRYVVYTEDGAHFSFRTQAPVASGAAPEVRSPENPVLVTGASIQETSVLEDDGRIRLKDTEVQGLLIDYDTLRNEQALYAVDLTEADYNTLVLELRKEGSRILQSEAVTAMIQRAQTMELQLIAMISCLDDSDYALEHMEDALSISGGALWMDSNASYFLDPTNQDVQNYLAGMIATLEDMGFQEVILDNFYFPESLSVIYDTGDSTREQLLQEAYESLVNKVGLGCTLSLLIRNPNEGHQAFDLAEHLYVCFSGGAGLQTYVENHKDYYMVFLTDSHDTRFEGYGKITTPTDLSVSTAATAE